MNDQLPPDPGPSHPHDLRRVLVLGVPPWPALGLIPEATLDPQPHGNRQICGVYRVRGGRRITVAVDPAVTPMEYVVEDALTGVVVQSGRVGERMNAAEWNGNSPRAVARR